MAADKYFELEIICPDRMFFQGKATMIELNTTEGFVGIYKRHIPMTMILEPGLVYIKDEEGQRVAALHEGFIEILPEKISIMAEIAEWPEEVDLDRAKAALSRARERITNPGPDTDVARARRAWARAAARIELLTREW